MNSQYKGVFKGAIPLMEFSKRVRDYVVKISAENNGNANEAIVFLSSV